MIIKFEVGDGWQMFSDVDTLTYHKLGPFSVDIEDIEQVLDYTETLSQVKGPIEGNSGRVLLSFMNSKQLAETQICVFSPVYIMNDNGRTVEVI